MTQTIRFEYETPVVINGFELSTIHQLASESPDQDIRIHADGNNNIKVHVGPLNGEQFRYWVYSDGRILLTEENASVDGSALDWRAVPEENAPLP